MPRQRNDHEGEEPTSGSALAVALMHDEHEHWLSSEAMTVCIKTKKTQHGLVVVTDGPPIVRRFINQPAKNLERWMRAQGGLQYKRLA